MAKIVIDTDKVQLSPSDRITLAQIQEHMDKPRPRPSWEMREELDRIYGDEK